MKLLNYSSVNSNAMCTPLTQQAPPRRWKGSSLKWRATQLIFLKNLSEIYFSTSLLWYVHVCEHT